MAFFLPLLAGPKALERVLQEACKLAALRQFETVACERSASLKDQV